MQETLCLPVLICSCYTRAGCGADSCTGAPRGRRSGGDAGTGREHRAEAYSYTAAFQPAFQLIFHHRKSFRSYLSVCAVPRCGVQYAERSQRLRLSCYHHGRRGVVAAVPRRTIGGVSSIRSRGENFAAWMGHDSKPARAHLHIHDMPALSRSRPLPAGERKEDLCRRN